MICFILKLCYFLSHPRWENAGDSQESLKNIPANPCSSMEKYSIGVEDEDTKFSGKCLFFQREFRISATKYFTLHFFIRGDIRENVVLWKVPAVTLHPVTLQHHGTIRACYKAGLLLLVVDAVSALCRRTQCPVLNYGCKIISRPRWLCY